jgi:hypothetical protein
MTSTAAGTTASTGSSYTTTNTSNMIGTSTPLQSNLVFNHQDRTRSFTSNFNPAGSNNETGAADILGVSQCVNTNVVSSIAGVDNNSTPVQNITLNNPARSSLSIGNLYCFGGRKNIKK